jgi:hypothetical protein
MCALLIVASWNGNTFPPPVKQKMLSGCPQRASAMTHDFLNTKVGLDESKGDRCHIHFSHGLILKKDDYCRSWYMTVDRVFLLQPLRKISRPFDPRSGL